MQYRVLKQLFLRAAPAALFVVIVVVYGVHAQEDMFFVNDVPESAWNAEPVQIQSNSLWATSVVTTGPQDTARDTTNPLDSMPALLQGYSASEYVPTSSRSYNSTSVPEIWDTVMPTEFNWGSIPQTVYQTPEAPEPSSFDWKNWIPHPEYSQDAYNTGDARPGFTSADDTRVPTEGWVTATDSSTTAREANSYIWDWSARPAYDQTTNTVMPTAGWVTQENTPPLGVSASDARIDATTTTVFGKKEDVVPRVDTPMPTRIICPSGYVREADGYCSNEEWVYITSPSGTDGSRYASVQSTTYYISMPTYQTTYQAPVYPTTTTTYVTPPVSYQQTVYQVPSYAVTVPQQQSVPQRVSCDAFYFTDAQGQRTETAYKGDPITLVWQTSGAQTGGVGIVGVGSVNPSGSHSFSNPSIGSHQLTLRALGVGTGDQVDCTASITVVERPLPVAQTVYTQSSWDTVLPVAAPAAVARSFVSASIFTPEHVLAAARKTVALRAIPVTGAEDTFARLFYVVLLVTGVYIVFRKMLVW